jgi:GT2 family glycosyltransferase
LKHVAIVIVNWNGKKYLKDCLDSISKQNYKDYKVLFVDNNSSDDSWEITNKYKTIELIRNKDNYGFAGGNNVGIKKALLDGYKYVVLVNYDTVVEKDWLGALVATMENHLEAGACQSKILLYDSGLINTTGNVLHYLGFSYCGNYKKPTCPETTTAISLVSGASVIFRSETLQNVGLFDEDFYLYHEDVDLSWRIKEYGYSLLFEPKSIIHHKYSFSRNKKKLYYAERNRLIFTLKNYQLHTLILLAPAFFVTEFLMIIYSILGSWFSFKVKGYAVIIQSWGNIMAKRKSIQKDRVINDATLKKSFSKKLNFDEISSSLFAPLNLFYQIYWFLIKVFI